MMAAGSVLQKVSRRFLNNYHVDVLIFKTRPTPSRFSKVYLYSGPKINPNVIRTANFSLVAVGLGAGAVFGAGYSWHKFRETKPPVLNNAIPKGHVLLTDKPDVPVSRQVLGTTDSTQLKLMLFQYPTCPFCCKVRAFLDYYGLSYDVVEVDPVLRQQTSWTEYKKVPILLAKVEGGYQQLNDSSMIISVLNSYINDRNSSLQDIVKFYPTMEFRDDEGAIKTEIMNRYFLMYQGDIPKETTAEKIIEERKWRKWADDVLVHTLSPNVYRTRQEAFQAFTWFSEVGEWEKLFPAWERTLIIYVGAIAMWGIGKRLKKRHNLKDDVRQSLYDECNNWMKLVRSRGSLFLGGAQPNLADLAVYGVLSSIEGCTAFKDLTDNTSIGKWYYPMQKVVKEGAGSQTLVN